MSELFQSKEIALSIWGSGRVKALADTGFPAQFAYPKEGAVGIQPTVSVPKGSPNKALAMKYIDVLLSPEGQKCFAEKKYAGPVNTKVELSDKVKGIVPFGESYEKLWYPDTDAIAADRPAWTERWQREVAR